MEASDFMPLAGLHLELYLDGTPKISMRFPVLPVFVFSLGSDHNTYNDEMPHLPKKNAVRHSEGRHPFAAEPGRRCSSCGSAPHAAVKNGAASFIER